MDIGNKSYRNRITESRFLNSECMNTVKMEEKTESNNSNSGEYGLERLRDKEMYKNWLTGCNELHSSLLHSDSSETKSVMMMKDGVPGNELISHF